MKYAINYTSDFRNYDEVDEIIFVWIAGIENLITRIAQPRHRIHIQIKNSDLQIAIPVLNKIKKTYPNLLVNLEKPIKEDIQLLKDNELKYMFSIFATNAAVARTLYNLGAEDIYIVEDLCFQLNKLQIFRENGHQLRIFPNVVQQPSLSDLPHMTAFWVRPEDTELYEEYIDTFEIFPCESMSTVFKIYKQRQWLGKISDIIQGFEDKDISNTNIAPHFGQFRLKCNRDCLYRKCNICMEITSLAKKLKEGNIEVIKKRFIPESPLTTEEKQDLIKELEEKGKELNESSQDN